MKKVISMLVALVMIMAMGMAAQAATLSKTFTITKEDTVETAYAVLGDMLKDGGSIDNDHFSGFLKEAVVIVIPKGWTLYHGTSNKTKYVGPETLTYNKGGAHVEIWGPTGNSSSTSSSSTATAAVSLKDVWAAAKALKGVDTGVDWAGVKGDHVNIPTTSKVTYTVPAGYKVMLDGKDVAKAGEVYTIPANKTVEIWKA